jgi:MiaB/RimO family radical SAM methylthiotransferase
MKKSVYIEHMGSCPGRALDASKFAKYFSLNGLRINKSPKKSDYILFISCAYKKNIEDIAIFRLKELSRFKAKIIVGGCLEGANPQRLKENFNVASFTAASNEHIDRIFPDFKVKFKELPDVNYLYPEKLLGKIKRISSSKLNLKLCLSFFKRVIIYIKEKTPFSKAYYIRVCDGCIDSHCSYCRIWRSVGKLKSKSLGEIEEEFKNALKKGCKKIMLIGENVGAYGLDIDCTLPYLLNRLTAENGNYEIQLECLNPVWLVKYIKELTPIIRTGKIRIIDCTIQSGNSRILKLMNRGYDALQLKNALQELKSVFPALRLHTHIMAGFPTETKQEFQDTLNIIKELDFKLVQLFPYCRIEETAAADLEQLPEKEAEDRIKLAVMFFRKSGIAYLVD